MFSFGYFPGFRLSFADVSEPFVMSIFKGWMKNMNVRGERGIYIYRVRVSTGWQDQWGRGASGIGPFRVASLTEGSETSAKLNPTLGKCPKENIQVSEYGENLKSRGL
jgi:hypothetical protein